MYFIIKTSVVAGKLLKVVENLEKKTQFEPIPLLEPLVDIPTDITDRMSTDSKNSWKLLQAVTTDHLPDEVAALKMGELNHSRYGTVASSSSVTRRVLEEISIESHIYIYFT